MSKKQDAARKRNFNIMVLRGMYQQLQRIKKEQPEIKLYCGDVQCNIEECLSHLGTETQQERVESLRKEYWRTGKYS